ncbi:NAD-dependent epimerase/dehydratase family protein [Bacillaceae bacterium W0354]
MKVIVTGGLGFIGSNVCKQLVVRGYEPIIIDHHHTNLTGDYLCYPIKIEDPYLSELFEIHRPKYVIHLAAQTDVQRSIDNPIHDAETNIIGTLNVLKCCQMWDVHKIIYSSSAAVYGTHSSLLIDESHPILPISPYGISKFVPELYIKAFASLYGISYTILRYANVYGEFEDYQEEKGVVSNFINQLISGKSPIIYGDGNQERDFIYVDDIAKANVLSLNLAHNKTINISTNTSISINSLYKKIKQLLGVDLEPIYVKGKEGDIRKSVLSNHLAKKELRWEPEYELHSGLKKVVSHYINKHANAKLGESAQ